jgi:hypothetical protein
MIGLPDRQQNVANSFKELHGQNARPWSASASAATSVQRTSVSFVDQQSVSRLDPLEHTTEETRLAFPQQNNNVARLAHNLVDPHARTT